jgi:hypothetical protein
MTKTQTILDFHNPGSEVRDIAGRTRREGFRVAGFVISSFLTHLESRAIHLDIAKHVNLIVPKSQ